METLRLYMVTWNVATRQPEEDLHRMLGLTDTSILPDFYVIGLQEVKSQPQNILMDSLFEDPWTTAYKEVLATKDYVKVKTIRLQGLLLSLYCLRKHLLHLRDIETQYTRTGFAGMWGNKGAVSIRLSIYGCSVCLVNCHLTAHDHLLQERVADYNTIITGQEFKNLQTRNILYHDYVFLMGDLNFRLSEYTGPEIVELVQKKQYDDLLEADQLTQAMLSGEAFHELAEQKPTFPPTYKFHLHSADYDLKRRPSWTDRILHKVNADNYENVTLKVKQLKYTSVPEYQQSDHKPVVADFAIKVFSDYHERVVSFLPVTLWYINEENSASYSMSTDVMPTAWDWVGLFPDSFSSLDDYLCYVYAPQQNPNFGTNNRKITFPETALTSSGRYRLIYFSAESSSVLGMSAAFQVLRRDNGHITQYREPNTT